MSSNGFKELPVISSGPQAHRPGEQGDPILGIDLGTTNSVMAIVEVDAHGHRSPRILRSREGRSLIPSVVHFDENGTAKVGYSARQERVRDAEHTVYSVKRL